jgi:cobalt/nickel transport system permease protein
LHISEGIISSEVAIVTFGCVIVAMSYLIWKTKEEMIGKIALISSLFFVASIVHIPIGATNIHLMLLGVIGVYLGYYSLIAIFIALLLQALLLGYGGISSLGANSLNIWLGAVTSYLLFKYLKNRIYKSVLYFLIGFLSIAVTSFALSLTLIISHSDFITISSMVLSFNLTLAFIEGFINVFIFKFLEKVGKI